MRTSHFSSYHALRMFVQRSLKTDPCPGVTNPGRVAKLLLDTFLTGDGHLTDAHLVAAGVKLPGDFSSFKDWVEAFGLVNPGSFKGRFTPGINMHRYLHKREKNTAPATARIVALEAEASVLRGQVASLTAQVTNLQHDRDTTTEQVKELTRLVAAFAFDVPTVTDVTKSRVS